MAARQKGCARPRGGLPKRNFLLYWKQDIQVSCFPVYNKAVRRRGGSVKIDRLIGILSVLLQRDTVTAPELAARFEVSRRTIGRDLEALCRAGIPIATRQRLHSRQLQAGPHAADRRGDAGYPRGPAQPRQRKRHEPLRAADGKARGRVVGFHGGESVRADRSLGMVPRFARPED